MKANKKILEKVKNRLVEAYNPLAIYLFGSRAWGEPGKDNDYDFLIVVPDNAKLDRPYALKGHTALSDLRISKDIIVTKQENFIRQANHVSTFYYKIKKEAVKIYSNGII